MKTKENKRQEIICFSGVLDTNPPRRRRCCSRKKAPKSSFCSRAFWNSSGAPGQERPWNQRRTDGESRREKPGGGEEKPGTTKQRQGLGLHSATPTTPLTARTQPPSPSPRCLALKPAERSAAMRRGRTDPGGGPQPSGAQEHQGRSGASVSRGSWTETAAGSDRDFFFLSSCSFSTESHQQRPGPRDLQETTPPHTQRESHISLHALQQIHSNTVTKT